MRYRRTAAEFSACNCATERRPPPCLCPRARVISTRRNQRQIVDKYDDAGALHRMLLLPVKITDFGTTLHPVSKLLILLHQRTAIEYAVARHRLFYRFGKQQRVQLLQ